MFIHPFHLVLSALAHWANKEQAAIIDYLREENRVLRDRLGPGRLRFTDAERRRLAAKAKLVCRSALREIGSLVTPDTLLRWHRQLIARNATEGFSGFLLGKGYLIIDRDPRFTKEFLSILNVSGVKIIGLPRAAPT